MSLQFALHVFLCLSCSRRVSLQVVPWTLVGQGGREAADGEGQERQLPGEGEPESPRRLRPVGPHRRRQDGQQRQQAQSHPRHDPLSGGRRVVFFFYYPSIIAAVLTSTDLTDFPPFLMEKKMVQTKMAWLSGVAEAFVFNRPMTSRLFLVAPPAARPEVRRRGRREVRLPDRPGGALQEEPHGGDPGDSPPAQAGTSACTPPVRTSSRS